MSIASEISRLTSAKSSIKTAIQNKGVTVPDATTLDGYSALIDQIGSSAYYVGTETTSPSANSASITFSSMLGNPKCFFVITTTQITLGTTRYVTAVSYDGSTHNGTLGYRSGSTGYEYVLGNSYISHSYSGGNLTVTISQSGNSRLFKSGVTYKLIYVYDLPYTPPSSGGGSD